MGAMYSCPPNSPAAAGKNKFQAGSHKLYPDYDLVLSPNRAINRTITVRPRGIPGVFFPQSKRGSTWKTASADPHPLRLQAMVSWMPGGKGSFLPDRRTGVVPGLMPRVPGGLSPGCRSWTRHRLTPEPAVPGALPLGESTFPFYRTGRTLAIQRVRTGP